MNLLKHITQESDHIHQIYYACSYAKVHYSRFINVTTSMALNLVSELLESHLVFLCINDTMIPNFGKKINNALYLFDHATHNESNYPNGHYESI